MNVKYYKEDDILVITFSKEAVRDSFEAGSAILEVDKNNEPVTLEILNASKFLKEESKALPKEVKKTIFASA